jgi:hypothetical protein
VKVLKIKIGMNKLKKLLFLICVIIYLVYTVFFICEGIMSDFIVLMQFKYNFHLFAELCLLQEIKALK